MRFVKKSACPPHLLTPDIKKRQEALFNYPGTPNPALLVNDAYQAAYRGPVITKANGERVSLTRYALEDSYYGKCAYCETRGGEIQIEHYRPKRGDLGGGYGYYWLCYEWTNLLPACYACNKGGSGKGTQFPISGKKRRLAPGQKPRGILDPAQSLASSKYLRAEEPALLHPELDKPHKFFRFELNPINGFVEIKGTDSRKRGEETIRICHLWREGLTENRKETVIQPALDLLQGVVNAVSSAPTTPKAKKLFYQAFESLDIKAQNPRSSHTLLRRYIIETPDQFEALVVSGLGDARAKAIATHAFRAYRRLHPPPPPLS